MIKFLLTGYFGFGNFGDEAILKCAADILKENFANPEITIATQDEAITKKQFENEPNIKTVQRFNFKELIKNLQSTDCLIFGGGSILQDATSLKSLLYYLFLIFTAKFFGKKVVLLSQGIGPINSLIGKQICSDLLKKVDLITVRDKRSKELLDKYKIPSTLTADLVWGLSVERISEVIGYKKTLGIQLRKWKSLTDKKLDELAQSVLDTFNPQEYNFKIISFQSTFDKEICCKFLSYMKKYNNEIEAELFDYTDINSAVNLIQTLDYLVAVRFHAGVLANKFAIPTLMLSYDPKVEQFCSETSTLAIDINKLDIEELKQKLSALQNTSSQQICEDMQVYVNKNIELLKNLF